MPTATKSTLAVQLTLRGPSEDSIIRGLKLLLRRLLRDHQVKCVALRPVEQHVEPQATADALGGGQ